jgi:hypothetical protein
MLAPSRPDRAWSPVRIAIALGALLFAVLAVVSGFDRAASRNPTLAAHLPENLRGEAGTAAASQAIAAGLPRAGFAAARSGLLASPGDPNASAMLGVTMLARGETAQAEALFRLSARLGWRAPLTQLYWQRVAFDQGDWRNGALRFDALARQYPGSPEVTQAAAQLEASPQGRAALAGLIAAGASWSGDYARIDPAAGTERLLTRAEVLQQAATQGRQLGCERIAALVRSLAEAAPVTGAALWRSHCPDAQAVGAIADTGLDRIRTAGPRTPFEWDLTGHGALAAGFESDGGAGQRLLLSNAGANSLSALSQLLALAPGQYRVAVQARPMERIRVSLSCQRDAPPPAGNGNYLFNVDSSCPARWLRLWLTPGAGQVTLEQVSLERL